MPEHKKSLRFAVLTAVADVPATIHHVLGVPAPAKLDGVPLF